MYGTSNRSYTNLYGTLTEFDIYRGFAKNVSNTNVLSIGIVALLIKKSDFSFYIILISKAVLVFQRFNT